MGLQSRERGSCEKVVQVKRGVVSPNANEIRVVVVKNCLFPIMRGYSGTIEINGFDLILT